MSITDISDTEARFTRTTSSPPAPTCMHYPGAGEFQLISATLFEHNTGPNRDQGHSHGVYHLVLFTQGDNEFILGDQKIRSSRGLCILTAPGDLHNFKPLLSGPTRYHAFTFTFEHLKKPPGWSDLIRHYTGANIEPLPAMFQIPERRLLEHAELTTEIRAALSGQGAMASQQLHASVLRTFLFVATVVQEQLSQQQTLPPEVAARAYLDAHFARGEDLTTVAKHAGVTTAHLSRAFQRRYGISPGRYQNNLRMDAARHLLIHSDLLIKEIAIQLGYPDAYTFSKAFHRHSHGSPCDFRKQASDVS